jgi:hypothetical protein
MVRRILLIVLAVGVALMLAIQLVPYGRQHTNPPVTGEPAWPDPAVRDLAVRACFDCHSNQVVWPWYSNIAPVSWLVQSDVDRARTILNFSTWDVVQLGAREAAEIVLEGEMPPAKYRLMHRSANLTAAETSQLAQGLSALR